MVQAEGLGGGCVRPCSVRFGMLAWSKFVRVLVRPGAARALEAGGRAPRVRPCAGDRAAAVLDSGRRLVEGVARAIDRPARCRPATAERRAAARGGMDAAG